MEIKIGERTISKQHPAFIIAEAGVNHIVGSEETSRSLERAYQMVELAKDAGCDAIKFQTFDTEKLQLKNIPKPAYQNRILGENIDYFDVLKSLETSKENQVKIAEHCRRQDIIFLSTPYDNDSVDFLDEFGVPAFKLASIETTNHLLLRHVAKKSKPVFLATGLADFSQVKKAVAVFESESMKNNLMLLQCNSNYPTEHEDINLRVISKYQDEFGLLCGLSDHSRDDMASVGAVILGGLILEKHFTLDKNFIGPDHSSSLNPEELRQWVEHIREAEQFMLHNNYRYGEEALKSFVCGTNRFDWSEMEKCLGWTDKRPTDSEMKNKQMKKFLVIKPISVGKKIGIEHLTAMRTGGSGVIASDENLNKIINAEIQENISMPMKFDWSMITEL